MTKKQNTITRDIILSLRTAVG
uniref:Uncharacterized protein n=1 Tax=Arundo donax TaxID=35708 RepID=A0A0A8ZTQ9_ARUDO